MEEIYVGPMYWAHASITKINCFNCKSCKYEIEESKGEKVIAITGGYNYCPVCGDSIFIKVIEKVVMPEIVSELIRGKLECLEIIDPNDRVVHCYVPHGGMLGWYKSFGKSNYNLDFVLSNAELERFSDLYGNLSQELRHYYPSHYFHSQFGVVSNYKVIK